MLQVWVHLEHVVVLVVLFCVIVSFIVSVSTYSLFTCMWMSRKCSQCENGSFEVLSLHLRPI